MAGYCTPHKSGSWCIVARAAGERGVARVPPAHRLGRTGSALRHFALDGTGHASRQEQASMIGRDSIWRNDHACGKRLRRITDPGKRGLTR